MLRRIYLSPLGRLISLMMNAMKPFKASFMIYGYSDIPSRTFRKHTRVSSSAVLEHKTGIALSDHVWVGHMCVLDGSGGLKIDTGVHLATGVAISTHSSHVAIRLHGADYINIPFHERLGYTLQPVSIGEFTFVGMRSIILPGVSIGRGCVIAAGSLVTSDVPDFAVMRGSPARIVGDTREQDELYLADPRIHASYYDRSVLGARFQKPS